jgi:hypothetical protein
MVIFFFDELEENSDLFIPETNFGKISKLHYEKLLRLSICTGKNGVLLGGSIFVKIIRIYSLQRR